MVIYFLIQSVLTLVIFLCWVFTTSHSGGAIGMTPLTVLLISSIQFAIAIIVSFFARDLVNRYAIQVFLLYLLLYEGVFFLLNGNASVIHIFEKNSIGFIHRAYSLSSVMAGVFTILLLYKRKVSKANSVDA